MKKIIGLFIIILLVAVGGFIAFRLELLPFVGEASWIKQALLSGEPAEQQKALMELQKGSSSLHTRLAKSFIATLEDKKVDPQTRLRAMGILMYLQKADKKVLARLQPLYVKLLQDPSEDPRLKQTITAQLSFFPQDAATISALMSSLGKGTDSQSQQLVIQQSIENEIKSGNVKPETVEALIQGFKSEDPKIREWAATGMARIGKFAVPRLTELLKPGNDPQLQIYALIAFSDISLDDADKKKAILDAVPQALESENSGVRTMACHTLRSAGSEAVPLLLKHVEDPDKQVKLAAINSLGMSGRFPEIETAVPVLKKSLSDPDPEIKGGAQKALDTIKMVQGVVAKEARAVEIADGFLKKKKLNWGPSIQLGHMYASEDKWYEVQYAPDEKQQRRSVFVNQATMEPAFTWKKQSSSAKVKPKAHGAKSKKKSKGRK